jgi:hypothetical protein
VTERLITFLTSQRYAVLRKSTGRRWNKEIIRVCREILFFFWKTEYLVELSFHLLKAHPHILQVTNFYSLPHLTTGASASELYLVFWKAVNYLAMFGFSVTFLVWMGHNQTEFL